MISRVEKNQYLLGEAKDLMMLEGHDWKWSAKKMLSEADGIYPDSEVSAFGTIFSVLGGMGGWDDTEGIDAVGYKGKRRSAFAESMKGFFVDPCGYRMPRKTKKNARKG